MSHELLYTSAPSGLKPGQHGFCTVAASAALPRNLWDRLEALSGYRHGEGNPVVRAHWLVSVGGGREVSVSEEATLVTPFGTLPCSLYSRMMRTASSATASWAWSVDAPMWCVPYTEGWDASTPW